LIHKKDGRRVDPSTGHVVEESFMKLKTPKAKNPI
jgi:hypothetical protein